jgi:Activator of Hsp90 ATPase homolog 1-like protein
VLDRPRVGGNYHIVFETEDGSECSFRGTYLEVEPPTRTVATWLFEGWPDADAVESVDLHEIEGVTERADQFDCEPCRRYWPANSVFVPQS